ncbi:MAG: AmmeMemoRadiSam system protein B, partial [Deltaproteobacteria bacterium]|nr:AmmeMemoRadiSam system protein B [Deltaproteobacteria bacterium]
MDNPRLRPVEAIPVKQDGNTLIYLKDPLNFASPLAISPVGYFILSHFDGQHSFIDIQAAFNKQFGRLLLTDELKRFIETMDGHYYLQSEHFIAHRDSVIDEFRRQPTRAAAHVGGVYSADPAELKVQLAGYFKAPKGPGSLSPESYTAPPRAIVAPHIDFHRGGPAYAWAYKALAESAGADLFILLGTSHSSGQTPFILTLKDFETPLGLVETDKDFVNGLRERCGENLFVDEYLHRGEHSVEFQVLFLKFIAQMRAGMTEEPERQFKIVPILVSSFHSMVLNHTLPEREQPVQEFLSALRELAEKETRRVCFVAGVDLAHVGLQFGDNEAAGEDSLKWVEAEDRKLIDRLSALDAPGFFHEVAKDQDKRRICGFSPLYSLIHLLDGARGTPLDYGQAFTPDTGSAVTFT